MILYLSSFVIFLFVSFSLFWKCHLPLWLKVLGVLLILLISFKFEIYQWIGGAFFAPQLPRPLLLLLEALYGALMVLFFLLLLFDLYLLGNWLMSKIGIPVPAHLPGGWIKLCLCFLSLGLGIFGTWQAVKVPDVRTIEMRLPGLPRSMSGLAVVQLSDLHIGPLLKKDWLAEVVRKTNELNPDLVLLTGDYIDGYVNEIGPELAPLADLRAKYGIFGVSGNHEYYWNLDEWRTALKNLGVPLLENAHAVLDLDGEKLVIAGVTDLAALRFGKEGPNLEKALASAPEGIKILLAHQPKGAPSNGEKVDIQLSGHTHGGLMFFLQPLVARFNEGFVNGFYKLEKGSLYVNPGTGLWNGFSCRIGVPAEITRIVLRPES